MSLDHHVLSETTVLWFQEMTLATDKIAENQQLALVAQSHPNLAMTSEK